MSKRARESFAAPASAKQKPVHCTAMIARKIDDKNADMDHHEAGGDSKHEELCQQDPQKFTINTNHITRLTCKMNWDYNFR